MVAQTLGHRQPSWKFGPKLRYLGSDSGHHTGPLGTMQDYEKLGVFYLGREYDIEQRESRENLLLYDSRDLCTHAVVVGMTGSGKTGLCVGMLEEAAIDRIPVSYTHLTLPTICSV